MDRIFTYAFSFTVFLGEQATEYRALFKELAAADKLLAAGQDCCRPSPSDAIVRELDKFFELPWFKRVWVLQGVCAKESVTFICGSAIASFEAILRLYCGYNHTVVTKGLWPLPLKWIHFPPRLSSIPQINLWHQLFESRDCLATDPRDRVFALISLTGSRQSELKFLIDYTQSLEECFTQVATVLIPVLGLRLLAALRHPHDMEMPSWVPNWSQNLPLSEQGVEPLEPIDGQKFEICSFPSKETKSCLELLVTGCRYAQVVDRSCVFDFDGIGDAEKQMYSLYYTLPNLRELFDMEGMQDNTARVGKLGQNITNALSLLDGVTLHMWLTRYLGPYPDNRMFRRSPVRNEFVQEFSSSLQQCRICLMDNDELAIVPASVRDGDVACVFSGAISVCVLRPDGNGHWILVSGDCYPLTSNFRRWEGLMEFDCDRYIDCQDEVEVFRVR